MPFPQTLSVASSNIEDGDDAVRGVANNLRAMFPALKDFEYTEADLVEPWPNEENETRAREAGCRAKQWTRVVEALGFHLNHS